MLNLNVTFKLLSLDDAEDFSMKYNDTLKTNLKLKQIFVDV